MNSCIVSSKLNLHQPLARTVQRAKIHTITATTGIFVVAPGAANTAALFEDDEVTTFVLLDQIDCHAHP